MADLGSCWFDEVAEAATFCAELVRQGVTFTMRRDGARWLVTLTGGY